MTPADNGTAAEGASAPSAGDSGKVETLPDGSISIPVLEERLVVKKETFVRERIIVSKDAETTTERIEDELRKEQVEVEVEER
jgi:uncharacterized protein (TIGR02271 family)